MPIEQRSLPIQTECRYLLQIPATIPPNPLLVITLHGYSSNPDAMLRLTSLLLGEEPVIASLEGPNQQYVNPGLPNNQSVAGYNWGIRPHWQSSVRLHHEFLRQTLASLRQQFQVGPERCLLVGFSQPVGLNYRFVATHPGEVAGVIGICGGVPRDWEDPKYQRVEAALLHISRQDDDFYPQDVVSAFPARLKTRAADVEFHLIPGPHRFPSKADAIARPWIQRVFGRQAAARPI